MFGTGELLEVYKISTVEVGSSIDRTEELVDTINVTSFSDATGSSFGVRSSPGIIYQRGHFLYADEQLIVVSKYSSAPDDLSIGYVVQESIVNSSTDFSLLDNANGSFNQNAPGADRLKLVPILTSLTAEEAGSNSSFFSLIRYSSGNAVVVRDVSQYNVLGDEMARRTFEESGDYVVRGLKTKVIRKDGVLNASISAGLAYIKGYRVETTAELILPLDDIANTSVDTRTNQAVSFGYGSYVNTVDSSTTGTVSLGSFDQVTLNDGATTVGTARVRNVTDSKIFLFDIRPVTGKKLSDAIYIFGPTGFIEILPDSVIQESSKSSMVFPTGMAGLNSTSDISIPVRAEKALSGLTGTTVTITPAAGEDFAVQNNDILFVDTTNLKIDVTDASLAGSDLQLTLDTTPSAAATIYYNKRLLDATPFTKESVTLYVKSEFDNTGTSNTKHNLGFPDVYEIVSITDSDSNDVTDSFKLRTNQRDNYYDHSYIEFIPGRPAPSAGEMTIEMNAFKLNDTTGSYFFTVDSYPSGTPKNKLQTFLSPTSGSYNLRDCIDFRPYVEPLSPGTYTNASAIGTAPLVSDTSTGVNVSPTFSSAYEILTPAFDQFGQLNYEFFFNRTDAVVIDSYSRASIVKGSESENSRSPNIPGDQLKIADIYIPGVPALSPSEATAQNKIEYSAIATQRGTRSYTMKSIENLEKKVDSLEYYVLLSALEAETKNLNIVDENGLTRFKNGIIVDPFNDLSIANLQDAEYSAAIDFSEKSLMPSVKSYPINLKLSTFSNVSVFPSAVNPGAATLQRNADISIINQPFASDFRNCVSNFYNYVGQGVLSPEYDALYDTTTNPVNVDIDTTSPLVQLVDAIQEFIPLTSTSSRLLSTVANGTRQTGTTIARTFRDTSSQVQLTGENVNEQAVGDFVTNFSFNPYMRSREVNIFMSGLRPNTQHYFFFDKEDINQRVFPAISSSSDPNNAAQFVRFGSAGSAVTSDASGVVKAVFRIPAETFFVGDRKLEIVDVDTYSSISSSRTSYGSLMYRAYNFSVEKSSLTISTRAPENFTSTSNTQRTVTQRIAPVPDRDIPGRDNGGGGDIPGGDNGGGVVFQGRDDGPDPLAQTFFIKTGMGAGSDSVFASKLDVYFKRKSAVNGVVIDIREVINGYPSYVSVPFSKVHLTPSQVQVSDDASFATTVIFPAPVRLDTEKEYAFAVKPDAGDPEYLIFTSKVGGADLSPGATQGLNIVQDWGDGVLFTSTNNRAWKSYQDEDVKFTLYRHSFGASTGSVTFTNDDNEFLTTSNNIGRFQSGELVYALKDRDGSTTASVSVVSGSNQISGTNLSATYSGGDYFIVDDVVTNKQVFKVISSNTSVIVADRAAFFTGTADATPIVAGNISHYNFRYPEFLILEKSSAAAARKFESADTIYGFDSDTVATIDSVDNKQISYIQPMISKTNDSVTSTILSGNFVNPTTLVSYNQNMEFNDKTTFGKSGVVIYSKSNDTAGAKRMNITVSMANSGNDTSSPFIDVETATVLAHEWKITNDSDTTSKYISKTIELTESLDAEDMKIFVTAHRPNGTDIKVYIKPQAVEDPNVFETNDWIELELSEGVGQYSSISNTNDFKEYVYQVANSDKTGGVLTYTNDISTFESYRRFAIKIELLSENIFKAPRLLDYRGISLT